MRSLNVLIAEDETVQQNLLVNMLSSFGGIKVAGIVTSGQELSEAAIKMKDRIDGLILDVDLGEGRSGLDTYMRLHIRGAKLPAILVTGASPDIQDVYDFGVLDVVSKPYTMERLKRGIDAMSLHIQQKQFEEHGGILVPVVGEEIVQIYPSDIFYLESDKVSKMTRLCLNDGSELFSTIPIKLYESYLASIPFARASRSSLVNINKINSFDTNTIYFEDPTITLAAKEERISEVKAIWRVLNIQQ